MQFYLSLFFVGYFQKIANFFSALFSVANGDLTSPLWLMSGLQVATTRELDVSVLANSMFLSSCAWNGWVAIDITTTAKKNKALAFMNQANVLSARVKTSSGFNTLSVTGTVSADVAGANEICEQMTPAISKSFPFIAF